MRIFFIKLILFVAAASVSLTGCDRGSNPSASAQSSPAQKTLAEAREGFATKLLRRETVGKPVPEPPPNLFRSVAYQSPMGEMAAYVSTSAGDGRKHPAIIWIAGGFANSVSEIAWQPGPAGNDQSGSAFREAGIVMMYPSLRGGNKNPGCLEGFYGEVDDVLAAADFLAKLDYVDPGRIYLGGHSTGGTLALLVAESSGRFRSVFSFGPVGDIRGYGAENLPFNISDRREVKLRSPANWLHAARRWACLKHLIHGRRIDRSVAQVNSASRGRAHASAESACRSNRFNARSVSSGRCSGDCFLLRFTTWLLATFDSFGLFIILPMPVGQVRRSRVVTTSPPVSHRPASSPSLWPFSTTEPRRWTTEST
jgi:pimeloyl-ACP methyl ester carboxylesterase